VYLHQAYNIGMDEERIKKEIRAAGVTKYGMLKFSVRYLPKILHDTEHVGGIVYGRYKDKQGSFAFNEGTLIATDKRIIFLDHKPGFTDMDEVSYDVLSGARVTTALFTTVVLRTKVGDYSISFANPTCAKKFIRYVENKRLEMAEKVNEIKT